MAVHKYCNRAGFAGGGGYKDDGLPQLGFEVKLYIVWLPQQNYVLEQRPTDSSPRADRLSPTASASELTNIITTLLTL